MRGVWILILVLLSSCVREHRVAVVLVTGGVGADAASFELEVRSGACPSAGDFALGRAGGEALARQVFTEGAGMSIGPLDPGNYAFVALGRRENCTPVLFGCIERSVGADDTIRIAMDDPAWSATGQRCPDAALCAAGGRCEPGDGGVARTCAEDVDCGPDAIVDCVSMACVPHAVTIRTQTGFPDDDHVPPIALAWAPEGDGRVFVHLAKILGSAGSREAWIDSLPLAALGDFGELSGSSITEATGATDAVSVDIRYDGANVEFSFAGPIAGNQAVAFGTLEEPGGAAIATWLTSAEPTSPLGPEMLVGGTRAGGESDPLHYVSRTRTGSGGQMGAIEQGRISAADWIEAGGPIPVAPGLRGAGSLGRWLVMEEERDGDLLFWRPIRGERSPVQRVARTGEGRPSLAIIARTSYALAYPSGSQVVLTAIDCDDTCDVATASTSDFPAEGPVSQAALVELPGGAFLAAAVETPRGVVLQGVVLDPSLRPVPLAGGLVAIDLLTLGVDDVAQDLRALSVIEEGSLHLIVAALVGPPTGQNRIVLADASFSP